MVNTEVFSVMTVNEFHQSRSGRTPVPRWEDKRTKLIKRAKGKMVNFLQPFLTSALYGGKWLALRPDPVSQGNNP